MNLYQSSWYHLILDNQRLQQISSVHQLVLNPQLYSNVHHEKEPISLCYLLPWLGKGLDIQCEDLDMLIQQTNLGDYLMSKYEVVHLQEPWTIYLPNGRL